MDKSTLAEYVHDACIIAPGVQKHLDRDTLMFAFSQVKTIEYFQHNIEHLVRSVYGGYLGGDFVDILGNLITGQMADAYRRAWVDNDGQGHLPEYLQTSLDNFIAQQVNFDWIYEYYKAIVDARVDGTSIDPLIQRANLWSNRYNEAYNEAVRLITEANGGKLTWIFGDTDHCSVCQELNGITAFAREWSDLGVKPQNAPNGPLSRPPDGCGGWRCQCRLEPTDKRRSPKAYESIMNIVTR